jgi:hypothetical protein
LLRGLYCRALRIPWRSLSCEQCVSLGAWCRSLA